MKVRKKWLVVSVIMIASVVLVGAPVRTEEKGIDPQVTLRVGTGLSGDEAKWFKVVLDKFEEKTGIKYEYRIVKDKDFPIILTPALDMGETPADILVTTWPDYLMRQVKKGHILEVTELVDESRYMPGILNPVKLNGRLYAGSWTGGCKPGFWYRRSFFAAHGLLEPRTWDEFVSLLETIKKISGVKAPIVSPDGTGWPLTDVTEHFLHVFGGPQLINDLIANKVKWTDEIVRGIFREKLVPLLEAGYFGEPVDWPISSDLWWANEYALQYMGSWIVGMVEDPEDLGLFTLPGATGVTFGPEYWFVPKYTKHPKEAKELFKFLIGAEAQIIHINQSVGKFSSRVDVSPAEYPAAAKVASEVVIGKTVVLDLDDLIGGEFKPKFYDGLKLLWVKPGTWEEMLEDLATVRAE